MPTEDPVEETASPGNISSLGVIEIASALGVAAVLATSLQAINYNIVADEHIQGREIHVTLTSKQLDDIKTSMKSLVSSGTHPTINQAFAVEDIVNYNCPNGFKITNFKGSISVAQLNGLIDGNCNQ